MNLQVGLDLQELATYDQLPEFATQLAGSLDLERADAEGGLRESNKAPFKDSFSFKGSIG